MNFTDTLKSVELVLAAGQVPLLVGKTGIGKTALAVETARQNGYKLVTIDGNLLKEGEIGGLPLIEDFFRQTDTSAATREKTTVYAVHHKLKEIDELLSAGHQVLLFIDEINRCEHAVQQELMNLILNREINGYRLRRDVHIVAAMNPSDTYEYEAVDMDDAQKNRFVWLYMEADPIQWLSWAADNHIEERVCQFISTYPEYLNSLNEDDINATPRSYERISKLYSLYKENTDTIPRSVFYNVIRGNIGKMIAEEFLNFIESTYKPLLTYEDVFSGAELSGNIAAAVADETHTRLYISAKNILNELRRHLDEGSVDSTKALNRLVLFLQTYPVDLMVAIMKDIRNNMPLIYKYAAENDAFIDAYFAAFRRKRQRL